jgi:predicted dehydrogenase
VMALYDVAGGATVSAEGSWGMTEGFGFNMSYTVNFERATADYDVTRGQDALRLFEPNRPAQTIQPEGTDGYVGELRYFAECVRSRRAPTIVTLENGWSALKICEAEEESIRSRQPFEISQSGTP